MGVLTDIAAMAPNLTALRRRIHAHPETGFEEHVTAALVTEELKGLGMEVTEGVGKTGVVGVLHGRLGPGRRIGLRADMDALPIHEQNHFDHVSSRPGKMHACGHDGHTAMLLGAARSLAADPDFAGTIDFIFQPAEEGLGGGAAMIADGLFDRFPCDEVYGMHNMPDVPEGTFAIRTGPMLAASDSFQVFVKGKGGHAAWPETTLDPVAGAALVVGALQTIVSRNVSALDAAVISVTILKAGTAFNVVPDVAEIGGTFRTLKPETRKLLRRRIEETAAGVAAGLGLTIEMRHHEVMPATINHPRQTETAVAAAIEVAGAANVRTDIAPTMGSEDFGSMLEVKPGAYMFIGLGAGGAASVMIHNPAYDFNDAILPLGASYWVRVAKLALADQRNG